MSAQETVKQHFVPRTYLKHFASDQNNHDKVYRSHLSDSDPDSPRLEAVGNICVYKKLYTLDGETIEERMALEDYYNSSTESSYNSLYKMLIDEKVDKISADVRALVLHTVVTMMMRTTKKLTQSNQLMDRVLDHMVQLCLATGSDSFDFDGHQVSVKGKTADELKREFKAQGQQRRVLTQLQMALNLTDIRQDDFGILVVKIDEQAGDYITSDNPVIVWSLERHPTAFYPNTSLRLPLDPKHMLCLMPGVVPEFKHTIFRWDFTGEQAKLDRMAAGMLQQENAERWIIGTRDGLQMHIKERITLQADYEKQDAGTLDDDVEGIANRMKRLDLLD